MPKIRVYVCLLFAAVVFSSLSHAVTPDRITGDLNNGQKVQVPGNMHGLAKPKNDLGRADSSRLIEGISLNFRLSPAQQKDMDQFLTQLANPSSPNYHKYLTPAQYAARFGMSQNDINKVVEWVQSEGFVNIKVRNNNESISFDGTVALIESAFGLQMHNYLVNGEVHLANATNPSVPAALANAVVYVGHLNDFAPKPRLKVKPHFTSYVSGDHFLTPGDFATIYDLTPLYSASVTGTGQKIAIVGQSTVNVNDLNNFRSAAGLAASTVTMTLIEGTASRCPGDEGESDLDLEWSGGVAKDAQIYFLYAGLGNGDTCSSRVDSVWDAMQEALTGSLTGSNTPPVAPFVSTSYGYCESGLGTAFAGPGGTLESWIQEGQTHGVTLVSASGDAGAADCDDTSESSATGGLAVDAPASIPETTGAGGNEFIGTPPSGDPAGVVTGNTAAATQYWGPSGAGSDGISTALSYILEGAWNDTTENGTLTASGGGASIYFTKPSWQAGVGVPDDGQRDVPDISLTASANHDGYLFCSEDNGTSTPVSTCTDGFRTGAGGDLTVVGGTSAVAPTFSAIMTLVNQYMGNTPPTGLAPINPVLYPLSLNTPDPMHDVTSGTNIVPCTQGSTGCPLTAPFQYGFSAGVGYDQVTGLGSVDAYNLAKIWALTPTTSAVSPSATSANQGVSVTFTATVSPSTATGTVNFIDVNNGSSSTLGSGSLSNGTATFATTSLPAGSNSVTAAYTGDSADRASLTTTPAVVTVAAATTTFTLSASVFGGTLSVAQGQTGTVNMTVTSSNGFIVSSGSGTETAVPVTYTCSGLPTESTCLFNGTSNTLTTQLTAVTLTVQTTAPTSKLERPLDRSPRIFYAFLMPGMLGILFTVGSRKRTLGGMKILALIMMLGFATLWTASCGGSSGGGSGNSNPGTPTGSSTVTVNATTGGSGPSNSQTFMLTVTAGS
jgi:hypothetical protein